MISIVVIEYHSLPDIYSFIDSIKGKINNQVEIIVSSNSLYDSNYRMNIANLSDVKWIFNEKNGGFAYGMNEGLKIAKGDILVVANPDVKLKTSIDKMVNYLKEHVEIGIIAPKIIDKNGIIQDSLRHYITPFKFLTRQIGRIINRNKLNVKNITEPTGVDWVIGAFMMVRRDFYERVGGLSEDYFMYCEDMDWCKRANLAKYDVIYFPDTIIEYKGTRSARKKWKYAKIFMGSLRTYWKKYGIK